MIKSIGSLSTNQIINHFANQNDKVQIDYSIALDMFKTTYLDGQGGFFMLVIFGFF
jgi:hypothetical protein